MIAELINGDQTSLQRMPVSASIRSRQSALECPGTVELASGNVILAPNLFWRDVPLGARLKAGFSEIPIYVDQDTNTAALGEFWLCNDPLVHQSVLHYNQHRYWFWSDSGQKIVSRTGKYGR
jgi:hypothetical protein